MLEGIFGNKTAEKVLLHIFHYIHFKARECLDQAALIAQKFPFDHNKVKVWCNAEGAPEAFEALLRKLKSIK